MVQARKGVAYIAKAIAVAAAFATSLYGMILGTFCLLGGWFVGPHVVLAGVLLLTYSAAGFFICYSVSYDVTIAVVRRGLVWSLVGLFVIGAAALSHLSEPRSSNDSTGSIIFLILAGVQLSSIGGLARLSWEQSHPKAG